MSLSIHGTRRSDLAAKYALLVLPLAVALSALSLGWRMDSPGGLIDAVSLLAGVLLAGAGELISLRARIADSVVLAGNTRLREIFREAVSGVLLASVAALLSALLLGVLEAVAGAAKPRAWAERGLTAAALAALTFVVLMFLATVRRLYLAYLEAFENGLTIRAARAASRNGAGQGASTTAEHHDPNTADDAVLRVRGIPERSSQPRTDS